MKRINPVTGKTFKRGDMRDDGLIFYSYAARLDENGNNVELWMTKEQLESQKVILREYQKQQKCRVVGRAIKMLHAAKSRAIKHGGKFTITKEWLREKLANGKCELTGLMFDLYPHDSSYHNPYAPSLDRIDNNNRDYTPENTRVILTAANIALSDHRKEDILPILKALVNALEKE